MLKSKSICGRYDRNFAPNVALSVEPFEEVRKQRAAESLAAMESEALQGTDDRGPLSKRRRAGDPSLTATDDGVDDEDDDDDNESVSSDKRESVVMALAWGGMVFISN